MEQPKFEFHASDFDRANLPTMDKHVWEEIAHIANDKLRILGLLPKRVWVSKSYFTSNGCSLQIRVYKPDKSDDFIEMIEVGAE